MLVLDAAAPFQDIRGAVGDSKSSSLRYPVFIKFTSVWTEEKSERLREKGFK
jgi:hypothetical protein